MTVQSISVCTCSGPQWLQIQESCWRSPWRFGQTEWGTEWSLGRHDLATLCSETDEPDEWSSAAPPTTQRNTDSELQRCRQKDTKIQRCRDLTPPWFWSKDPVIERRSKDRRLHRDSKVQIQKYIKYFSNCFSNVRCRCWTLVWSTQVEQTLTTSGRSGLHSTEDPDQMASSDHTSPGAEQEQQTWTRATHDQLCRL